MASDSGARARITVARVASVAAPALVLASLPVQLLLGPAPRWLDVPALQRVAVLAVALLLGFAATRRAPELAWRLGLAVAILAAAGLAIALVAPPVAPPNPTLLERWAALCPPPGMALGMLLLAGSLATLHRETPLNASVLLNTLAVAVFFLLGVAHLFGAAALVQPPGLTPSHGMAAALLLVLSLAALGLHAAGPLSVYAGADPGAVAKRRLLPAAVLTPIGSGYLLMFALDSQRLSPTLAVAVTVFANVLVMLVLVNAAGNKVQRVVWDRQRRQEAREAQVRKQGLRDVLTQLLNRRGWDAEIEVAEKQCRRDAIEAGVLVFDLDGLKQVNDTEGHKAGDQYIQRAAAALRKAARRGEPLARLGGDEFAYVVLDCDEEAVQEVVGRFQASLRHGRVSASVGYAMRGDGTLASAFEEADAAMYAEKRARKLRRA